MKDKNLRNMSIEPGQGKVATESSQLNGLAKPTKAFNSTNETKQYYNPSSGFSKSNLGGENTGS